MAGTYRTLEITLTSAKDLQNVNVFSKLEIYAVVNLSNDPQTKKRTPTDRENGRNPKWNAPMKFQVPASANNGRLNLDIYLRTERALGDRDVGEVHVPIKEFASDAGDTRRVRYMSYQVRRPSGKPKGVITLEYKSDGAVTAPYPLPKMASVPPPKVDKPVTAYPVGYTPPKVDEPVTAYPVGYTPLPPAQNMATSYAYPPPPPGYPLHGYGGYDRYPTQPPQKQPPVYHQSGYGYGGGYGGGMRPQKAPKKNKFGMGLGAGLLGGALGGLLVGDVVGDAAGFDCDF